MKRRILLFLFTIFFVLSGLAISKVKYISFAEEAILIDSNEFYDDEVSTYSVDDADTVAAEVAKVDASSTFSDVESAAKYFRGKLVNRTAVVKLAYKFAEKPSDFDDATDKTLEMYYAMRDIAFAETGNPKEGDYLYWNWHRTFIPKEGGIVLKGDTVTVTFEIDYISSLAQERKVDLVVNELLDEEFTGWQNKSDFQNIIDVYDWVTYNYIYANHDESDYSIHSSYSGLVMHNTVCQGYATSIYRLLGEMGISTRVISNATHGWNIVKLGSKYYDLDSTWDTGRRPSEWEYFLRCEENFDSEGGHYRGQRFRTKEFNKLYPMAGKDYSWDQSKALFDVVYKSHVQGIGWQDAVSNGAFSGTEGESRRIEAFTAEIKKNYRCDIGIQYMGHIQSYGWNSYYKSDGDLCGTTGQAKRIEAIKFELTGKDASKYDIYYRVHVQSFGWLGWAKNGESAGTEGLAKRIEGIKIVVLPSGKKPEGLIGYSFVQDGKGSYNTDKSDGLVSYKTHVQSYGWQNYVYDGSISGTSGESKRLEGIMLNLNHSDTANGIRYKTHVQTYGWQDWAYDGAMSGTSGESKRLEAIAIELYGNITETHDVFYRVHAQTYGWLGWAKNGESAGTEGLAKRLEGIQIVVLPKGMTPSDYNGASAFVK